MARSKKEVVEEIIEDEISNSQELGIDEEVESTLDAEEKVVNLNGKLYVQTIDSFGSTFLEPLF